jgi:hypothetical protein
LELQVGAELGSLREATIPTQSRAIIFLDLLVHYCFNIGVLATLITELLFEKAQNDENQ